MHADHRDPAALAAAAGRLLREADLHREMTEYVWDIESSLPRFEDDLVLVATTVTALSEQHARALAILEDNEWEDWPDDGASCRVCGEYKLNGHMPHCWLAQALDALRAAAAPAAREDRT